MFEHHHFDGAPVDQLGLSYEVPAGTRDLVVGISATYAGPHADRPALIAYKLIDDRGHVVVPNGHHYRSSHVGFFFYLDVDEREHSPAGKTVYSVAIPPGVVSIELAGHAWSRGVRTAVHELVVLTVADEGLSSGGDQEIPQWILDRIDPALRVRWSQRFTDRGPVEPGNDHDQKTWSIRKEITGSPLGLEANREAYRAHGPKEAHKFKVALICDEFTFNSFSPEFDYVILEPDNWRERVEEFKPDFLFCESAWSGVDSHRRPWRGQVYASAKFPRENRGALLSIIAYCKEKSIPTVFWNKEDPTHFHDRVNDFVSTASRFDYVLTSAEEMLDEYRKFMPADRVDVLQFAAQPREFNPLHVGERENRAVFAGAWYDIHEKRSDNMRAGMDAILDAEIPLLIHDRNLRSSARETNFPEPYSQYAHPAISHKATAKLYRSSRIGLNFNTVTESTTMFARRVFELAASGALVVSNYSPGIERIYGENVLFFDHHPGAIGELNVSELNRMAARAFRETMSRHTYRQRFEQILTFLGLRFTSGRPAPTMMTLVDSSTEAEAAVRAFNARKDDFSKLLMVVARSVPSSRTGRFFADYSAPHVNVVSEELISTERVPSTNFLSTPDVIWVDRQNIPSPQEIEAIMLHGEYTRHPVRLSDRDQIAMTAGTVGPGVRLAAIDVVPALAVRSGIQPILEVTR